MPSDKEFDRSVCFMFYESYLAQAELIKEQCGADDAYSSLAGIIKYALYKEEPTNMMAKIVLEGLKNTIDAGQAKRAKGFANREDSEMTERIIQYKKDNPDATYDEIKEALGCSKGKISKALKNFVHDVHDVHDNNTVNVNVNKNCDSDVHTFNSNSNINSNSNSNINTVNVNVNKGSRTLVHDVHDVHVHSNTREREREQELETDRSAAEPLAEQTEQSQNQSRVLADLSIPERRELVDMYDQRMKYNDICKHFSLSVGSLDKNKIEKIREEVEEYDKNKEKNIIISKLENNPIISMKLSEYLGYSIEEIKENLSAFKMQPEKLIICLESDSKYLYTYDYWKENQEGKITHWDWISRCYEGYYDDSVSMKNSVVGSSSSFENVDFDKAEDIVADLIADDEDDWSWLEDL